MLGIPAPAELSSPPRAPFEPQPPAPEPVPEREHGVAEPGDGGEAEWTVAVTDDQHEDMTSAQVIDAYVSGRINEDTFIWAEGMDDWKNPFDIPLIAMALEARGFAPGIAPTTDDEATVIADALGASQRFAPGIAPSADDEATVIADALGDSQPPGVWREPGSWRARAITEDVDEGDVSFDDVTVSMDGDRAAELLRAAGASDTERAPSRDAIDELMDDSAHDDVTLAVDSRPFFAESAPLAASVEGGFGEPDFDEEPTMAMEAPRSEPRPTGARNEDSVLFSLNALAGDRRPEPKPAARAEDEFLVAPPPVAPLAPAPSTPAVVPAPEAAPAMPPPQSAAFPQSAPVPSVAPRKRSGLGWLWLLLLLLLAGAGAAAAYYFQEPRAVFEYFGLASPTATPAPTPAAAPTPIATPIATPTAAPAPSASALPAAGDGGS